MKRPTFGLTLLAPWLAFILRGDKRLENRSQGVATVARRHIGATVALTQSLRYERMTTTKAIDDIMSDIEDVVAASQTMVSISPDEMIAWAGCWIGTAKLVAVQSPSEAAIGSMRAWHSEGQWGLILGDVQEREPTSATGGLGFWRAHWCRCGRLSSSAKLCKTCRSDDAPLPQPNAQQVTIEGMP